MRRSRNFHTSLGIGRCIGVLALIASTMGALVVSAAPAAQAASRASAPGLNHVPRIFNRLPMPAAASSRAAQAAAAARTWSQKNEISDPNTAGCSTLYENGWLCLFGYSVAISGHTMVVGAPGDNCTDYTNGYTCVGAVYVYTGSGKHWTETAELKPPEGDVDDPGVPIELFGWSVALTSNTIVVGAPCYSTAPPTGPCSGVAYVYTKSKSHWTTGAILTDPTLSAATNDYFGWQVAIPSKSLVTVSAFGYNSQEGAVFAYNLNNTSNPPEELADPGGVDGDWFGNSLAVSGRHTGRRCAGDRRDSHVTDRQPGGRRHGGGLRVWAGRRHMGDDSGRHIGC